MLRRDMRASLLGTLIALAACGGGSGKSDKVTVHAVGAKLVATRAGNAAWKPQTPGELVLDLAGPTAIVSVCDDPGFFDFYTIFAGPGAGEIEMGCTKSANVDVMIQAPATVFVTIDFFPTHGGTAATVVPGTHDVVAVDTSTDPARFEIRRNVDIRNNMTLTFDPAMFTPMNPATVTADATDASAPRTRLVTANDTFVNVASTNNKTWLFPKSAMIATDHQSVSVSATSTEPGSSRYAQHSVVGDETSVAIKLPSYLGTVGPQWTGTAPSVSLQLSEYDRLYFLANDPNFEKLWDGFVFPEFGDASSIALPDPTEIPGWQSSWNLPDHAMWEWQVTASHEDETDARGATKTGTF